MPDMVDTVPGWIEWIGALTAFVIAVAGVAKATLSWNERTRDQDFRRQQFDQETRERELKRQAEMADALWKRTESVIDGIVEDRNAMMEKVAQLSQDMQQCEIRCAERDDMILNLKAQLTKRDTETRTLRERMRSVEDQVSEHWDDDDDPRE